MKGLIVKDNKILASLYNGESSINRIYHGNNLIWNRKSANLTVRPNNGYLLTGDNWNGWIDEWGTNIYYDYWYSDCNEDFNIDFNVNNIFRVEGFNIPPGETIVGAKLNIDGYGYSGCYGFNTNIGLNVSSSNGIFDDSFDMNNIASGVTKNGLNINSNNLNNFYIDLKVSGSASGHVNGFDCVDFYQSVQIYNLWIDFILAGE